MRESTSPPSALITGASSGFGYELTETLLNRGWRVFASLRNLKSRDALFDPMKLKHADRLQLIELDVTSASHRQRVYDAVQSTGWGLDCLVNNAGFGLFGALEDLTEEQIRHQMEVNYFGLFFLTRTLLPLLRQRRGKIINLSSTLGFTGMPLAGAYAASKFAVEGMSECLALDLDSHVQVCLVEPGAFKTQFGSNMTWGENSFSPDSWHREKAQKFKHYRERTRKVPSSQIVVDELVALCESNRVPLRVRIGKDAQTAYWSRRLLGNSFYFKLMKFVFGRLLR